MTTKFDELCKAACCPDGKCGEATVVFPCNSRTYAGAATAVLASLSNPTDEMVEAAAKSLWEDDEPVAYRTRRKPWEAVRDVALAVYGPKARAAIIAAIKAVKGDRDA